MSSIYFHWPFCSSKCPYCDFASIVSEKLHDYCFCEKFGSYLLIDLKNSFLENKPDCVQSIFFGGGTPSLMSPKSIEKILDFLFANCFIKENIEITLEANPATFDEQKIKDFYNAGINRLSLGIQSFSDNNLKFLGRIYGAAQAYNSAEIVSKIFENFNFDFMYGYESQSIEDLEKDLTAAVDFGCKHISCYKLTFEKDTPFYKRLLRGDIKEISEYKEIQYYNFIEKLLKEYSIYRYEISNYSMSGFESRHNLAYWKYNDYLGIGPGSHSRTTVNNQKIEIERLSDPFLWAKSIEESKSTISHKNILTFEEKLKEILIMGLRLVEGLRFCNIYKNIPMELVDKIIIKEKLQFLYNKKLTAKNADRIKLTKSGLIKMNSVLEFLLM